MLKGKLIHPEILASFGSAGHGARVLIADGNFPFAAKLGPRARLVPLNLSPGIVGAVPVLEAVASAVPIEAATVMRPQREGPNAMAGEPPIWHQFRDTLSRHGSEVPLEESERFAFYELAEGPDVVLTLATAEQAIYANLLLTIGVVAPPG